MRKKEIANWDGGKSTWGGRVRVFGTVLVCVSVQERAGGEGWGRGSTFGGKGCLVEKRNASKFCEFHGEVGHTTDECKDSKEGESPGKDKPLAILMVQPWQKIARQMITQTFSLESVISFPTLGEEDGTEGPIIIEAEMGVHCVHRIYVDRGSSSKILKAGVRKIRAIPSTAHEMIQFPVAGGIVTLQSSKIISLECSMVSEPKVLRPSINQVKEEKIQVVIHPEHSEQTIAIGSTLTEEGRKELCRLLRRHLDVFAWKPADMTGVPRHIVKHRLNVREGCLLVRQKKRGQAPEKNKAISKEVKKLVEADIMKEVHWLSNPVMVKKHDDNWIMCSDFKDLNKVCPKDGYPLPKIDWKVGPLCGYPYKCFLDAYKGYHQIKMAEEDEEKTAFITSQGILCYSKMSFGLKNVEATYQSLVDKAFQKQIGQNLEVYVGGLVIKSRTEKEVIRDAEETFKTLRKINMKLNPKKCAFGIREGTFLGYKVDADGLRVSSDKVKAVIDLPSPNRKILAILKTMKKCTKKSDFQWTPEAEEAFKEMKQSIAELPMLTAPKENEELIIYLAAAKDAISAVLMTERDGKQVPIYFVSRALQVPEINYTPMEKLILALVSASKRLKRYFQAHTIVVITDQPIKQLLSNPEVMGRLLKWRFELGEHDIQYRPRTSVKGQILADFIVECPEDGTPDTPMEDREELPDPCILFTDGSSYVDGSWAALIAGLRIASQMGIQNLQANVDSKLVANQVNGIYIAKESSMIRYLEKVKNLANTFKGFSIKQIPKGENKKAYALSKITSTRFAHLSKKVLVEELREKEIDGKEILVVVEEEGHTWMTPVYEYLTEGVLPEEKKKARTVRRKAGRYAVINEVLYKKSFLGPWLRCVGPLQANYVLREIHEGSCGMHAGPRSVVAKALRTWQGKFLIVAIDYFTKWIEAKPVATITGTQVKKFVWDNIVCRFGLPGEIISDNGKQFRDNPFKDWCEKLNIRQCFDFVKHPQANSLVERANRSLGEGIKARLGEKNKNWVEEVSHVLWAHRTMIKSSNGETPFSLTYGTKAVIPAENGMPTLRTVEVDMAKNNEALRISLDLLEEKREQAAIQEARNKAKMEGYYNARVRSTNFRPGDFVYRNNEASHAKTEASSDLSGRDRTKSQKHWVKEHTSLKTTMDTPFRKHGTSATLKSVTYMKCKHPFARKAKRKKKTLGILFVCNIFKFLMNEK
nr:reverse transcriptase domain-containing protein [Tanacetum cinerariifolium]